MKKFNKRFNRLPICVAISLAFPMATSALEIGPIGEITGATPELRWIDTSTSAVSIEMELLPGAWSMDQNGESSPFLEVDATAPADSFVIDSSGNMGVNLGAGSSGATQPAAGRNLHVGGGQVLLDSFSSQWWLNPGGLGLWFKEGGTTPFKINNSQPFDDVLVLNNGRVGVGTGSPDKRFHVRGADSSTGGGNKVAGKVENTTGTTGIRTMFELVNNGDPRFRYINTDTGQAWALNPLNGGFRITLDGSGVTEFQLSPGGDLQIAGTLTEMSDRNQKHGVETLDAREVLSKVSAMPVTEWSYNATPENRHIGPMAQDFHAAFGLGLDEKQISPRDLASVSLIAIQAQQDLIEKQADAIKALTQQLKRVEESIGAYGLGSSQ